MTATHTEPSLRPGLVVAAYGKRYEVELEDGATLSCVTRGKKTDLACGDRVEVRQTAPGEGVVERTLPRASLLYRSNAYRSKMLAANVTQIVVVLAAVPSFYEELLNRCLIAAEAAGIRAVILLNKSDLPETMQAMQQLESYRALGYPVLALSALNDAAPLRALLHGHTSVLVGQSGMGKSTLINALVPEAHSRTQQISTVLDSGKHTTTAARLYHLDADSHLIDSPGLQEFGLSHLDIEALEQAFVEFRPFLGKCRFANCRHLKEPDCAVSRAVEAGLIRPARQGVYQKLLDEVS